MGAGAITVVMLLPQIRRILSGNRLVMTGTLLQSFATLVMAFAPNVYVAVPAMFLGGMAWLCTANSLSVSAQMALPDWVRARGMSMYQMAIMGGSALGAALWGQVATVSSLTVSLLIAAVTGSVAMFLAIRRMKDSGQEEDLTPSREFKVPAAQTAPLTGHVVVTFEYRIDPARAASFVALMQQSRRSRLRQGALSWELLHDLGEPGRYVEQVVDESWTEHLRRFDRVTAADVALRDRKLAFHVAPEPPVVTRYEIESSERPLSPGGA
jgi:MFS family permease